MNEKRNKRNLKFSCSVCGKSIVTFKDAFKHPLLGTSQCSACSYTYNSVSDLSKYRQGVDHKGQDNYCRWCLDGGDLILCSDENCHHGFCNCCIERNLGNSTLNKIQNSNWYCFVCDYTQLDKLRADTEKKLSLLRVTKPPLKPKAKEIEKRDSARFEPEDRSKFSSKPKPKETENRDSPKLECEDRFKPPLKPKPRDIEKKNSPKPVLEERPKPTSKPTFRETEKRDSLRLQSETRQKPPLEPSSKSAVKETEKRDSLRLQSEARQKPPLEPSSKSAVKETEKRDSLRLQSEARQKPPLEPSSKSTSKETEEKDSLTPQSEVRQKYPSEAPTKLAVEEAERKDSQKLQSDARQKPQPERPLRLTVKEPETKDLPKLQTETRQKPPPEPPSKPPIKETEKKNSSKLEREEGAKRPFVVDLSIFTKSRLCAIHREPEKIAQPNQEPEVISQPPKEPEIIGPPSLEPDIVAQAHQQPTPMKEPVEKLVDKSVEDAGFQQDKMMELEEELFLSDDEEFKSPQAFESEISLALGTPDEEVAMELDVENKPEANGNCNETIKWALKEAAILKERLQIHLDALSSSCESFDEASFQGDPNKLYSWVSNIEAFLASAPHINKRCQNIYNFL